MTREKLQELALTENAAEAADLMLQNALDNGGKDNISLILLTDETENVLSGEQDTGEAVPAEDNGEARE